MRVDVWSDVVCPWCYVGKRRLEDAVARFEHTDDLEVAWRAFELDPTAPLVRDVDLVDHLASKYGVPRSQAETMNERVTSIAADEGLPFRLDIARPGNTFDSHRLLHLAADRAVQDDLKEELLVAYQTRGEAIGDHDVLLRAAVAARLDEAEARAVLNSDRYAEEVRADERAGQQIGVTGVPFFLFDGRYAVSGAQSSDVLLELLERTWSERTPLPVLAGDACGADGCELPV